MSEVIDISPNNLDSSLCFIQPSISHDVLCAGLEETQAGIKIAGRNINNLRYANDTTIMAESEEKLKSLLMKVKVEMFLAKLIQLCKV